jgi:hypothetical protein
MLAINGRDYTAVRHFFQASLRRKKIAIGLSARQ